MTYKSTERVTNIGKRSRVMMWGIAKQRWVGAEEAVTRSGRNSGGLDLPPDLPPDRPPRSVEEGSRWVEELRFYIDAAAEFTTARAARAPHAHLRAPVCTVL